jgi:hypothetical protein
MGISPGIFLGIRIPEREYPKMIFCRIPFKIMTFLEIHGFGGL